MGDKRIEVNHELYDAILSESELRVRSLIFKIERNRIIIPRIVRSIVWDKKRIKELIVSFFKGLPIGVITMWNLLHKNPNIYPYRTILNSKEPLPEEVNCILDGLQRCTALATVFSTKEIAVDKKFQGIDLYYNIIKDIFMFKEEIKELDSTWINLKETYNPLGINTELKELFIQEKLSSIRAELNDKEKRKIHIRIERIFGLVNKKLEIV